MLCYTFVGNFDIHPPGTYLHALTATTTTTTTTADDDDKDDDDPLPLCDLFLFV